MTVPWPAGFLEGLVEGEGRDPPAGDVPALDPDIEVADGPTLSIEPSGPFIVAVDGDDADSEVEREHPTKPIANNKTTPIDLVIDRQDPLAGLTKCLFCANGKFCADILRQTYCFVLELRSAGVRSMGGKA